MSELRKSWIMLVRNVMEDLAPGNYEFAKRTLLDWIDIAPDVYDVPEKEARAVIANLLRQHFPVETNDDPDFRRDTTRFSRLDDYEIEKVKWLWGGRIPFGKPTLLDGDPGLGKSTLTIDIAARVTTGRKFPDQWLCEAGKVILLSAEDGLADTVRPRLDAAGGDASKVIVVEAVFRGGVEGPPDIETDIAAIERICDSETRLLIIDPLMAYLSPGTNAYRDHEIRRSLLGISDLAKRTGVAVLMVRHLRKGAHSEGALYAGGGSIGIAGAARSVLLVGRHPDNENRRILAPVKCNLTRPPDALAFEIENDENDIPTLAWDNFPVEITADELIAGRRPRVGKFGKPN